MEYIKAPKVHHDKPKEKEREREIHIDDVKGKDERMNTRMEYKDEIA